MSEVKEDPELLKPKLWRPAKSALSVALLKEIVTCPYTLLSILVSFLQQKKIKVLHLQLYKWDVTGTLSILCIILYALLKQTVQKNILKDFVLNKWRQEEHDTPETLINKGFIRTYAYDHFQMIK